jgi:hypothetical protein
LSHESAVNDHKESPHRKVSMTFANYKITIALGVLPSKYCLHSFH